MQHAAVTAQVQAMQRLTTALRKMGTASAVLSQSVAKCVGLSSSDLECLDMIYLEGSVTAGRIAEYTKLTTGAVTGLIDRLERSGYVERIHDTKDRRRVVVRVVPANIKPIQDLYVPMSEAATALMRRYSAAELELIAEFIEQGTGIAQARSRQLDDG